MAGRPPKPTHIKLLEGNPGRRPVNAREPKPQRGIPKCPEHLTDRAKKFWKRIAPHLDKMGVLTIPDGAALEMLCEAYAEYWECRDAIVSGGATFTAETQAGGLMVRARPEVAMQADAWRRIAAMMAQFGLTPSSRTKVHGSIALGQTPKDDVDPMDTFLSGKKHGRA